MAKQILNHLASALWGDSIGLKAELTRAVQNLHVITRRKCGSHPCLIDFSEVEIEE